MTKPRTPIARSTRPARVNRKRAATKFKRNFHSRAFVAWVKFEGRCDSCGGRAMEYECSHAEPRGMGGCGAGWWRIFRQCSACHSSYQGRAERFLAARWYSMADVEQWIARLQREAHERGILSDDDMSIAHEHNEREATK